MRALVWLSVVGIILAIYLIYFIAFVVSTAGAGGFCPSRTSCVSRPAPTVTFRGDRELVAPISVTVCHGYWGRLASPRWWNPTIRFGGWEQDLPPVRSACKTYSVKPGTDMRLFASCVQRVIGTGPMRVPGTYTMR